LRRDARDESLEARIPPEEICISVPIYKSSAARVISQEDLGTGNRTQILTVS
jgi:hypothetical protein